MKKRVIKHKAAREAIIRLIRDENYKVGDPLPSVARLGESLKTGKMPVQQAVKLLEQEGVLENIPGSGCYVKSVPLRPPTEDKALNEIRNLSSFPGAASNIGQKNIKVGILSEMQVYGDGWKTLFLDYMRKLRGIHIELIPVNEEHEVISVLAERKVDIVQVKDSRLSICADKNLLFDPGKAGGLSDLPWDEFYSNFQNAAAWKGKIWGVPLVIGVNCMFYRKKYERQIAGLNKISGFWNWLENAQSFMKSGKSKIPPPLFVNDLYFMGLLSLAGVKLALAEDYDLVIKNLKKKEMVDFAERFEPFLRDSLIWGLSNERYRIFPLESFLEKDIPIVIGSSAWLPTVSKWMKEDWGFAPVFQEDDGACDLSSNINVISAGTPYPEECVDILRWLASSETQGFWSSRGRIVANKIANSSLKLKNIATGSRNKLDVSIEKGKFHRSSSPHTDEYIRSVMNPEFLKWQEGHYKAKDFLETLDRKTRHYFNAKNSISVKGKF